MSVPTNEPTADTPEPVTENTLDFVDDPGLSDAEYDAMQDEMDDDYNKDMGYT